jgi:hypothetical protein
MAKAKFVSLQDVKDAANDYLLLDDDILVEIPLAVYVANKLVADPLWAFICGPPSNAKTEILRAMNDHRQTKFISSLTPNTLLSGKQGLVIKDFTTILNLRDDQKSQILSQLREVYDGQISKAYGSGEFLNWKGKIGLIAAVTPIIDRHMSVNQLLGERFIFYRTSNSKRFPVAKRAMSNMLTDDRHREKFHDAMTGFMKRFAEPFDAELVENEDINHKIAALAVFCATARSGVSRDRYKQTVDILPQAEGPARLAKQLKLLATGLAIIRDLPEIDEGIYEVVKKVARDSLPSLRLKLLDSLWSLYSEEERWYTTRDVAMKAGVPTTTAKLKLENMHLLDLLERDLDGEGDTAPYIWIPSVFLEDAQNITDTLTNKINGEGKERKIK